MAFSYDGALPVQELYSDTLAGSCVQRQYDSDFRLHRLTVGIGAGASAVDYAYEPDGLIKTAGAMTLTRDPQHGLATATLLGGVSTQHGYTPFVSVRRTRLELRWCGDSDPVQLASSWTRWQRRTVASEGAMGRI